MTLRLTMIILVGVVMLATLLLGSMVTYLHGRSKIATEMQAAIAVGGRSVHNAVDDVEVTAGARRRLELLVANFDGDRHLRAEVLDAAGNVLMSSKIAEPDASAPQWLERLLADEPLRVEVELPAAFQNIGRLVLSTDSHNEVSEAWEDMQNALLILSAFSAMVLGLVYGTIGRALRPLEGLSRAFTEIGEKGYGSRLPEAGPIELQRVYHGFNEMVDRLERAETHKRILQEQLSTVQEEERAEIARDLHDEIGPFLFAADVDAAAAQKLVDGSGLDGIHDRLHRIRDAVGHVQRHVRDLLGRLRAGPLTDLGLAAAVDDLVTFWRGRHPAISFDVKISPESFGEPYDATVYRLVQECISNAVKHGDPTEVVVSVGEAPGGIEVAVEDNGRGLAEAPQGGFGIKGMKERVAMLGGTLTVAQRAGMPGVQVLARIPVPRHLLRSATKDQPVHP